VINTVSNAVVTTIAVGAAPYGVAVDSVNRRVYVANRTSDTLSVIDGASQEVVDTVPLPVDTRPFGVAVTPDGATVLITGQLNRTVLLYQVATGALTTLSVGAVPSGVAVNPVSSRAYVANQQQSISVIDMTAATVVNTIRIAASQPYGVAVSRDGTRLYATNLNDNTVLEIDTATESVVRTYNVGQRPYGISVNHDGTRVYTADILGNTVSVINTVAHSVSVPIPVGTSPFGLSINREGTLLYVANFGVPGSNGTVSVVDLTTNSVVKTITVQHNPAAFGQFIEPPMWTAQ